MRSLYDALPVSRRGGYSESVDDLVEPLARTLGSGDVLMVKGSNASRAAALVDGLTALSAATREAR